jgi:hypothetical protein
MAGGTCYTCNIRAPTDLAQHYRSPFHAHNLRLRNADVPPLSWSDFSVMAAQAAERQAAVARAAQPVIFVCDACGKTFATEGPFAAHCKSKRHVTRIKEILALRRSEVSGSTPADVVAAAAAPAPLSNVMPARQLRSAPEGSDVEYGADGDDATGELEEGGESADEESALLVSSCSCLFCFLDHPDIERCERCPKTPIDHTQSIGAGQS